MKRSGFTLIEVLIAGVIFAQVALVGAAAMSSVFKVENQTTILRSRQQTVRSILESIARDVRWANDIKINTGSDQLEITPVKPDGTNDKSKTFFLNGAGQLKVGISGTTGNQALHADDIVVDEFIVNGRDSNLEDSTDNPLVYISLTVHSKQDKNQKYQASTVVVPRRYSL